MLSILLVNMMLIGLQSFISLPSFMFVRAPFSGVHESLIYSATVHCGVCTVFDFFQIQWDDVSDSALSPRSKTLHTHYHRRFSAHFSKVDTGYSATILCYARKLDKLQVHKDMYIQLMYIHTCRYVPPASVCNFGIHMSMFLYMHVLKAIAHSKHMHNHANVLIYVCLC